MHLRRRITSCSLAAAMFALATTAAAFHDEPRRAKALKAPLVTAYLPCTSPNTQTLGFPPLPACYPAVRADDICGFATGTFVSGYAKASGKARPNGDFKIDITAKGLNQGCEGQTLCGVVRVRATTHRCAAGPCTVMDLDFTSTSPTACCTVVSGVCIVQTTINSEVLGTLLVGDRTAFEVYGFGLRRTSGVNPPASYSFVSGGLTP